MQLKLKYTCLREKIIWNTCLWLGENKIYRAVRQVAFNYLIHFNSDKIYNDKKFTFLWLDFSVKQTSRCFWSALIKGIKDIWDGIKYPF